MTPGDLVWARFPDANRLAVLVHIYPQYPAVADIRLPDGDEWLMATDRLSLAAVMSA